ncbi:DUF302 domain-containing protein [Micromonospora sp. NBC_01796]|uniref:DUF302 domain-containing protein n=1 Tax=Micromonospora sp. NBC_01796 TaxID=2975987 RepID=UPI002DDA365F|nr:DUF302 domain-containing protein [Micromonospora sp. NBC_01796]WSA82958.1 DUF302 domain-containing protein [Micromonospora sp. NBC_01796]
MGTRQVVRTEYQARRLAIAVDAPFDDFRRRYEEAVPVFDPAAFKPLYDRKADWSEWVEVTHRAAPHDFLRYWQIDAQPMMGVAGDPADCVQYLMGNHTVAERMFRHDPTVFLYVPLRVSISDDGSTGTWFSIDQPSRNLDSYGRPEITSVGVELDHKVGRLLEFLGVSVPPDLLP